MSPTCKEYAVAVDLGGTNLACALVDRRGHLLERTAGPSRARDSSEQIIANMECAVADLIARVGHPGARLAGIGVGAPGIVYADRGVIHRAAHFPEWQDVPLARLLAERFSLPVFVRHDVDMAVLAEKHYGAGRGKDHIVCLTIGTGIGMGVILNGELYSGARAGAGNFGHLILDHRAPAADDRNRGYLESRAGGPAIQARAVEALRRGDDTLLRELCGGEAERLEARMVFDAAREGDACSLRIVDDVAHLLGLGIANVVNLLDPEVVIVGGSIALAGEVLFAPLVETVRSHVCGFLRGDLQIVPAQLGDDAGLIGAGHAVWEAAGGAAWMESPSP